MDAGNIYNIVGNYTNQGNIKKTRSEKLLILNKKYFSLSSRPLQKMFGNECM